MTYAVVALFIFIFVNRMQILSLRRRLLFLESHLLCERKTCPWWMGMRAPDAKCKQATIEREDT